MIIREAAQEYAPAALEAETVQYAPAHTPSGLTLDDLAEPEWASIRPLADEPMPVQRGYDDESDGSAFAYQPAIDSLSRPALLPEPGLPEPDSTSERRKRGMKATKDKRPPKNPKVVKQGRNNAGGRWKIKVFRGFVFLLLGVLILGGIRNLIAPSKTIDVGALTAQVATGLGETGFPTTAGEAFAVRFANTYLTYDPKKREGRDQQLAAYSSAAASGQFGLSPGDSSVPQAVLNGPFIAAKPESSDANNAVFTVATQVTGGAWVYLAIPVYSDSNTGLVIAGPPAFVAPPAHATSPGGPSGAQPDEDLGAQLTKDVLSGYFTAWAKSDVTALNRYTTPNASPESKTGLGGAVAYQSIAQIKIPRDGGDTRQAVISVLWKSVAGTYTQGYRVTMTKLPDGRWYVADIKGGVVTPGTSTADDGSKTTATTTPEAPVPAPATAKPPAPAGPPGAAS